MTSTDLLTQLEMSKYQTQSEFCDICGWGFASGADDRWSCKSCPSSFHTWCLGKQDAHEIRTTFFCHSCSLGPAETAAAKYTGRRVEVYWDGEEEWFAGQVEGYDREAQTHRVRYDDGDVFDEDLTSLKAERSFRWADCAAQGQANTPSKSSYKPPATSMQCFSCGYLEKEAISCADCGRWYCFGCMGVSARTLPEGWCCLWCVGLVRYDKDRRKLIAASRRRIARGEATAQEHNIFSQLTFDLLCTCSWADFHQNVGTLVELTRSQLTRGQVPAALPFHSLHYSARGQMGMDKATQRHIAEAYAENTKAVALARISPKSKSWQGNFQAWKTSNLLFSPDDKEGRLRVGYLSADFVDHPTCDLILSALLQHDRSRFEIYCYSISREDDSPNRARLQQEMEQFRHFPETWSDKRCAQAIAADGIHILINLNGHTAGERNGISALRPAPLQMVYLAYPGTMGADYIDYNVTDKNVAPKRNRKFYTERLLLMPNCYQVNSFKELYSDVLDKSKLPSRADHRLPAEPTFIFCCFCRLGRITPEVFACWMRILKRVPNGVIWLSMRPKAAVPRLQAEASKAGVRPERLIFGSPCRSS